MGLENDLAENILLSLVRTGVENDFEEVVFPEYPSLREIKRLLMGIETGHLRCMRRSRGRVRRCLDFTGPWRMLRLLNSESRRLGSRL